MKYLLSTTLLVATTFSGGAAAGSASETKIELSPAHRDIINHLSTQLKNPQGKPPQVGDFTDAFACTADLSTGSVIDETNCGTATDADGGACVWCDASAVIGTGLCVTSSIQTMAAGLWGSMCASEDAASQSKRELSSAHHDIITDLSTQLENPQGKSPLVGDFTDAFACTADLSTGSVIDETNCGTTTDVDGGACVWCDASAVIGTGLCVTSSIQTMAAGLWGSMCASEDAASQSKRELSSAHHDIITDLSTQLENPQGKSPLVGDFTDAFACTADLSTGSVIDETNCGTTTDADGGACVWCDASAVIGTGLCVTSSIQTMAAGLWGSMCASEDAASQSKRELSSAHHDIITDLSTQLENPQGKSPLVGDFTDAFACTADLSTGSVIDETNCGTTTDVDGGACVWCDASAVIGTGLCVTSSIQTMAAGLWDSLCASDDGSTTPVDPAPTPPTPNPTPEPVPVPVPDDNNDLPDALKCSLDASSSLIADESTCTSLVDSTSATGEKCVWCNVPVIGGSCITNSDHSTISFLCSGEEEKGRKYLRGTKNVEGMPDLACAEDALGDGTRDSCAAKVDSNGDKCVWCDDGATFAICATSSQSGYLGSIMTCADAESSPVEATE
eukprot:CAMPEP_0196160094 /NCGR_PEP_ID=MMETSP0910-20130528/46650_1 /TAXON_ID=49265 /ORGANISM="Thalassiosira rotula, Strain GSO102" /LENGTH=619 /DNA_ID=CAMNT_0041425019 /DNA_START=27 /DNA_END=1886 /DNA_ORIENTATION=+